MQNRSLLTNMSTCFPFSVFSGSHLYLFCYFILFQFCLSNQISDHVLCLDSEREALLTFKRGLIDETHRLASWDIPENKDCCKWVGIACDNSTGHVHRIHLRALDGHCVPNLLITEKALKQRLRGGISSSLLDLKQLKHLDLSCNDFELIKVPEFIGSLEKLRYLNLSSSNFSGVIPPQIGNLSKLHTLSIGTNSFFSFEIPFYSFEHTRITNMQWVSNLGMLHHLDLSGVDLHEATNWLHVINTLPSLVQLHMRDCGLTDIHLHVPSLNITSLSFLHLSGNNFSSSVPRWIFSITSLVSLDITFCEFQSIIPSNIYNFRNLTSLKFLHAGGNDFLNSSSTLKELSGSNLITLDMFSCGVSSSSLESLHNLTSLGTLELSRNQLTKRIPKSFGNLCDLRKLGLSANNIRNISLSDLLESFFECKSSTLDSLDLSFNAIDGTIPYFIQKFSLLRNLDISFNKISGPIPYSIGLLSSLEAFHLGDNQLIGPIPNSIGQLPSLEALYLHSNQLDGPIPYSIGQLSSLEALSLSINQLNGPIPHSIGQLSSLVMLNLDYNQLDGLIPHSIGQLSSLIILNLEWNQLNGPIPYSIGQLSSLEKLDLGSNQLNGPIPYSIGQLSSLRNLFLVGNQLNDFIPHSIRKLSSLERLHLNYNNLNGPIPHWIGQLSSLEELHLDHNQLHGSLPESVGQLSKLESLWFSHNTLTGVVTEAHFAKLNNLKDLHGESNNITLRLQVSNWIPPFQLEILLLNSWVLGPHFPLWIQSQTYLRYLDISNTSISSPIPESFFRSFPHLQSLDMSHNHIQGTLMFRGIPASLSDVDISFNQFHGSLGHFLCFSGLKEIVSLELGNNHFSGAIPDCWDNFPGLVSLNIENNNITGELPRTFGFLTLLHYLNMHGNKITGNIPAWMGTKLTNLKILVFRSNNFEGNIPDEFCYLIDVHILDLSHNNLSGNIPRCFNNLKALSGMDIKSVNVRSWMPAPPPPRQDEVESSLIIKGREDKYSTILEYVRLLDLSSNNLVGPIPGELTSLRKLKSLNLSRNQLTGSIPKDIGEMIELESLDLSLNKLFGELPTSLSKLNFLSSFNVSYNNLVGRIPTGTQIQSFDKSSFLGNKLDGPPLTEECCVPVEVPEDAKQMKDNGRDWGLIISMVLGFVAGFWMIVGPLIVKRSWRIAYFEFLSKLRYMF